MKYTKYEIEGEINSKIQVYQMKIKGDIFGVHIVCKDPFHVGSSVEEIKPHRRWERYTSVRAKQAS